jgi:hypothetical protein
MASTYFENICFYRDLVSRSATKTKDANKNPRLGNEASDTSICARIRPLSDDEAQSQHISGIVAEGLSSAALFEPRKKFNGSPDAIVSPNNWLLSPSELAGNDCIRNTNLLLTACMGKIHRLKACTKRLRRTWCPGSGQVVSGRCSRTARLAQGRRSP